MHVTIPPYSPVHHVNHTSEKALSPVIQGCIETLEQGCRVLNQIEDEHYTRLIQPHFSSTIGQHFRHWLDMFHALYRNQTAQKVDYDKRRRHHQIEQCRILALVEIEFFMNWMKQLSPARLTDPIIISTELSMTHTQPYQVQSTLEREIIHVTQHACHHYAIIRIAASMMARPLDQMFGFAPTTMSHLRNTELSPSQ